MTAAYSET